MLPSEHCLEFILRDTLLRLIYSPHKSSLSTIYHLIWPSHPHQRGSTQSKLKRLECLSSFFIQLSLSDVTQFSHVTSWATGSWILKDCLLSLDFPSLTAYTYFPTSASRYLIPLIYFRKYILGCLFFYGDLLNMLAYP